LGSYEDDDDDDVLYAYFLNELCGENDGGVCDDGERDNSHHGFLNGNGSVWEEKEIYDGVSFLFCCIYNISI
jgi:hypothetical protein